MNGGFPPLSLFLFLLLSIRFGNLLIEVFGHRDSHSYYTVIRNMDEKKMAIIYIFF